jgi:hypothetical protein
LLVCRGLMDWARVSRPQTAKRDRACLTRLVDSYLAAVVEDARQYRSWVMGFPPVPETQAIALNAIPAPAEQLDAVQCVLRGVSVHPDQLESGTFEWEFPSKVSKSSRMAPRARFELATLRLTAECSTIELPGNGHVGF